MNNFRYLLIIFCCMIFCERINSQKREIDRYIKKVNQSPDDQSNYLRLAELYRQEGNLTQVNNVYTKMLNIWIDNAHLNYQWALTLSLMGKHLESLPHYYTSLKLDSLKPKVMYNYSISLLEVRKYKVALRVMEIACKLDPQNNEYLRFRNKISVLTQSSSETIKAFNSVSFTHYYNQAIHAYNVKDLQLASKLIDNAINLEPNNTKALFAKAQIALDQKDYNTAIQNLQQLLKHDPDNYEAFFYLGEAYYITKNYENSFISYFKSFPNQNSRPEGIKNCKAILRIMKLQGDQNFTQYNNILEGYLLEK